MFSKQGTYPAVGLFTPAHIISIVVCFAVVAVAIIFTWHMKKETYRKLCFIFAIVVTVLELVKIGYNVYYGERDLPSILPLYFCSLFIYALWMASGKKGFVKDMGLAYIAIAGMVGGAVFIISPVTSFSSFPIFHFRAIHSMVFHVIMVYMGFMSLKTESVVLSWKYVLKYFAFCAIFMVLALIVNITCDGNLMFISNPGSVPLPFLKDIYNYSKFLFTTVMIVAHLSLGPAMLGISKLTEYFEPKKIEDDETKEQQT